MTEPSRNKITNKLYDTDYHEMSRPSLHNNRQEYETRIALPYEYGDSYPQVDSRPLLDVHDDDDGHFNPRRPNVMPERTLIPLNHYSNINPTFVNPKQYDAILRRRMKKMNKLKGCVGPKVKIKKKFKYASRSIHAKSRKRAKNGKFLPAPRADSEHTASTVLRPMDEEVMTEEKEPCCAEEEERQEIKQEPESKVKIEQMSDDDLSVGSQELFGHFQNGRRNNSRREQADGEGDLGGLRRNDSLFQSNR